MAKLELLRKIAAGRANFARRGAGQNFIRERPTNLISEREKVLRTSLKVFRNQLKNFSKISTHKPENAHGRDQKTSVDGKRPYKRNYSKSAYKGASPLRSAPKNPTQPFQKPHAAFSKTPRRISKTPRKIFKNPAQNFQKPNAFSTRKATPLEHLDTRAPYAWVPAAASGAGAARQSPRTPLPAPPAR